MHEGDSGAQRAPAVSSTLLKPTDEGFFRAIVDTSADPIVVIDRDFVLRYVSQSVAQLLSYDPDAYLGRSIVEFLDPETVETALAAMADLDDQPQDLDWVGVPLRANIIDADGSRVPVDVQARHHERTGVDGYVIRVHRAGAHQALHNALDTILAGSEVEKALWNLAAYAQHSIPRSIVSIGIDWTDAGFVRVIGPRAPSLGNPAPEDHAVVSAALAAPDQVTDVFDDMTPESKERAIAAGIHASWIAPIRADGVTAAFLIGHAVPGPPTVTYRKTIERSVNLTRLALEWMDTQRRLAWDVTHDPLTKLANRPQFHQALAESLGSARAVLFCDLDDFKPVNEGLGHQMGDRVLAAAAGRIAHASDPHLVARMGGDEFGVLITGTSDPATVQAVASRIRRAFDNPITVAGASNQIGVTIGIAFDPGDRSSDEDLMGNADQLMREGKAAGKNQIRSVSL